MSITCSIYIVLMSDTALMNLKQSDPSINCTSVPTRYYYYHYYYKCHRAAIEGNSVVVKLILIIEQQICLHYFAPKVLHRLSVCLSGYYSSVG